MKDFIALNVPRLLARYSNPSSDWRPTVLALARTQIDVMRANEMISPNAAALSEPVENAVLMFSDLTPLGQEFLMTGETDRWLAACDRAGNLAAYEDHRRLEKRVRRFLDARK